MLVLVSDTHSTDSHRLAGRTLEAVREAELVVHVGDFMHESVLDAFIEESPQFLAVYGNNDDQEIRSRIPEARNFSYGDVEFAVTHTRRGGPTALTLFGRERGADAVIFGHSHRPTFDATGAIPLLNPGSHAQPRGNRKAHAELEPLPDGGLRGRLVTVDGSVFKRFTLEPHGRN